MELKRFNAELAVPLETDGASGVKQVEISEAGGTRVSTLYFDPKGEIGRRELPYAILLMVLEGSSTIRLRGEIREVTAGDAVLLPANTMHMIWTTGTPMTALTIEYRQAEG
jgi:quercetin dioxygenase-like cupin family protein